ncbi:MAG: hypothetical protein ACK5V3_02145 [Bdellovibrionales bacterium]
MDYTNVSIQYRGFYPSDFTQEQIDSLVCEVENLAPSGSEIRAQISREGKFLKASLRILSRGTSFFVKASGTALRDVAEKLSQQAKKKISKWKSKKQQRFNEAFKLKHHSWSEDEVYP